MGSQEVAAESASGPPTRGHSRGGHRAPGPHGHGACLHRDLGRPASGGELNACQLPPLRCSSLNGLRAHPPGSVPGGGSARDGERESPQDTVTPGKGDPRPAAAWRWCLWQTGEASPLGQYKVTGPRMTPPKRPQPPACPPSESAFSPTASRPLVAMTTTAARPKKQGCLQRGSQGPVLLLRRSHLLSRSHLRGAAWQPGAATRVDTVGPGCWRLG